MIICGNCKHVSRATRYCMNQNLAMFQPVSETAIPVSLLQAGCVFFEYKDGTFPEKEQDE